MQYIRYNVSDWRKQAIVKRNIYVVSGYQAIRKEKRSNTLAFQ